MKKLLLPLLLIFSVGAFAQKIIKTQKVTDHSVHVFGNNFEGVIFTNKYDFTLSFTKGKRFTPSENEILVVEKILKSGLDTVQDQTHQTIFIMRHLKKYLRQYFGYIDENGNKIISINLLWKNPKENDSSWLKELYIVSDGGNLYWRIKVNLKKAVLFDYEVNGEA